MNAEILKRKLSDEQGQTILELVFLLPILFTFSIVLFKMMLAVQMAINNTQFARSQVYMLTANSPEYPRIQLRNGPKIFTSAKQDRMVLGVAEIDSLDNDGNIEPNPQTQKIAAGKNSAKGSSDRGEVTRRTELRVRDTSAICTQLNGIPVTSNERWPFKREVCRYEGMI
jgi:hypothetical protein